jgi:hypothetical protein
MLRKSPVFYGWYFRLLRSCVYIVVEMDQETQKEASGARRVNVRYWPIAAEARSITSTLKLGRVDPNQRSITPQGHVDPDQEISKVFAWLSLSFNGAPLHFGGRLQRLLLADCSHSEAHRFARLNDRKRQESRLSNTEPYT